MTAQDLRNVFEPGSVTALRDLVISREPLDAEDIVAGAPSAGFVTLGEFAGLEVGVWEMSPGTATDVEVNELFLVIAGHATVHIDGGPTLELAPGALVRLAEGMHTTWIVRETLRKVYVA